MKNVLSHLKKPFLATRSLSTAVKGPDIIGALFFGSICLGAGTLGVWQVQRYNWKVELIEKEKNLLLSSPVTLPKYASQQEFSSETINLKGKRVELKGEYLHSREILLGPRSGHKGVVGAGAQGMGTNPQGFYIITPFKREDGTIVFVSRGWIPSKSVGEELHRPVGLVSQVVVISEHEQRNTFSPPNDFTSNRLLWLEAEALPPICGMPAAEDKDIVIAEVVRDSGDSAGPREYPYPRSVEDLDHQNVAPIMHATYALTWFSLAVAGLIMTYFKFRPKTIRNKLKVAK